MPLLAGNVFAMRAVLVFELLNQFARRPVELPVQSRDAALKAELVLVDDRMRVFPVLIKVELLFKHDATRCVVPGQHGCSFQVAFFCHRRRTMCIPNRAAIRPPNRPAVQRRGPFAS